MSSSTIELFVASFGTEDGAHAALKDFQSAHAIRCHRPDRRRRDRAHGG